MTTITIDRAVVEQALEALEAFLSDELRPHGAAKISAALRAALAQQDEPVEPVAWECRAGGLKPLTQRQYDAQTAATKRHYTRIAPPQRQPLTDATLWGMWVDSPSDVLRFARAVERAHGIKE